MRFDPTWVEKAKQGDHGAFEELYSCSYQAVHIVILTMIRADEDTVADLIQDTYLKIYQRLDQLEDPEKFRAWAKQIAKNTALDYLKKSKTLSFSEVYADGEIPIEIEDPDTSHLPDIVVDRQETIRLLYEILDTLPDAQRTVISMHYLQGIPVKEIAATLGRSENTIKVQLFQGRKSLEAKIRDMEKKHGIKLFSLAPMPFLVLVVQGMEQIPVQPDAAMLDKIYQAGSASTVASAAVPTATARSAFSGIVGKIAAVAAALAVGGGAIGIYTALSQKPAEIPTEPTVSVIETAAPTEPAVQYDYEQLIEDYTAIIRGTIPIDATEIDLSKSALNITPAGCSLDENGFFVYRRDVKYYFVEYDINDDQVMELIILEGDSRGASIIDIFTYYDGQPVWLIAGEERGPVTLYEDNVIGVYGSGGISAHSYEFYHLQNGALVPLDEMSYFDGTYEVNGSKCSEEAYWAKINQYTELANWDFEIVKTIDREVS